MAERMQQGLTEFQSHPRSRASGAIVRSVVVGQFFIVSISSEKQGLRRLEMLRQVIGYLASFNLIREAGPQAPRQPGGGYRLLDVSISSEKQGLRRPLKIKPNECSGMVSISSEKQGLRRHPSLSRRPSVSNCFNLIREAGPQAPAGGSRHSGSGTVL